MNLNEPRARVRPTGFVFILLLVSAAVALGYGVNEPGKIGNTIPTLVKLITLGMGTFFAWRSVTTFERGSTVRLAWTGMALWLSAWTVGQAIFTYYLLSLRIYAPTPSFADPPFILGYICAFVALVAFVSAWRDSGMVDTTGAGTLAGLVAAACAIAAGLVFPVAIGTTGTLEQKAIMLAYPAFDFVLLVPSVWMLRTSRAFGGHVWPVWFCALTGVIAFCAGDILYIYFSGVGMQGLVGFVDYCYCCGYAALSAGAWLQSEL